LSYKAWKLQHYRYYPRCTKQRLSN